MSADIKNLENLAYKNARMPEDLELPEQLLFLSLRCIYGSFKHNQIDKITAEKEKNQILRSYETFRFWANAFKQSVDMKNKLSYHILQINKNGCEMCKKSGCHFYEYGQVA